MLDGKIAGVDKKVWLGGLVLAGIGVWWWQSQKTALPVVAPAAPALPSDPGVAVDSTAQSPGGGTGSPAIFPVGTGPVPGNVITSVSSSPGVPSPGPVAVSGSSAHNLATQRTGLVPVLRNPPLRGIGPLGPA